MTQVKIMSLVNYTLLGSLLLCCSSVYAQNPADYFKPNSAWVSASKVSAVGNKLQVTAASDGKILVLNTNGSSEHLTAREYIGDSVLDS
jgi:hypothetical protein